MKSTLALAASVVLCWGIGPRPAYAAPIFLLSGDANVTNALNGTFEAPIDPGNQRFFSNILQGGNSVLVQTTTNFPEVVWGNAVNGFYNSTGISSTLTTSPVADADLAHVNLFVSIAPDAFSATELSALTNFLNGGGSVFFLGDNSGIAGPQNMVINSELAALGSNLAIALDLSEGCADNFHQLSGSEIANDPLTAGVSTFTCAAGSAVYSRNILGGSTVLFTEFNGNSLVIYEPYGTPQMPVPEPTPIPEPTSVILFSTGAVLLCAARRRKHREQHGSHVRRATEPALEE
jgi:hypothetical protein